MSVKQEEDWILTGISERACEHGKAALAALQTVQADGVASARKTLATALDELVKMRDVLIDANRVGNSWVGLLERTNAVISSLFGTEFPSSDFQWKRVQEARQALKRLLDALEAAAR